MTEEQQHLIHIIAYELFEVRTEIEKDINWKAVLKEAKLQAVFPIAYSYLNREKPGLLEKEEYQKDTMLKAQFYASSVRNLYYHTELHKLLSEKSVPYVILKGQASASYYPDPILRTMGDVDFLVGDLDSEKVDSLLLEAGFVRREDADKHDFHWAYHRDKTILEMHWKLPGLPEDSAVVDKYTKTILEDAAIHEATVGNFLVPSKFHHGLVLLLHTLSHMTSTGIGLRHLLDWLVFENGFSEDEFKQLFENPLKEIGIWTFAQALTQIGVLHFGCRERSWCEEIDEELCNGLLEDIINGGNFGIKDDSRKIQTKLLRNSLSRKIEEGEGLHNLIANVNTRARRNFPLAKSVPVLLPIGWVTVGIDYVKWALSRGKGLDADTIREAQRRQKLYSKLKIFENT